MQEPGPPPHPQAAQDAENLKLLVIFHYVLGGITGIMGCFPIIHVVLGAIMVSGGFSHAGAPGSAPPEAFGWFFIVIGGLICLVAWTLAAMMILSGKWLSERKNWTFCFVIACISCLSVPLGTVLGVFTILVLQRPSVKALFEEKLPPAGYLKT
jgi:hypothetical protein